jgi:sodium transport system permease protein
MIRISGLRAGPGAGGVPEPWAALGFVALAALLFFFGGLPLQVALGEGGLLASEWLLLFLPALGFVVLGGYDVARTLSLRGPTLRALAAGALLVTGALPLGWLIGWLQTFVLPVPTELLEGLDELLTARDLGRFLWLMLFVAITPAVCEEIVFRGVLLGGTRALEPWRMILLNGVVFGVFHVGLETLIRFLPTALLGALIAWAVWRTGSIWVGALMHLLNNASIVVITSAPPLRDGLADSDAPPPLWLIALALLVFAAGVRLLPRGEMR